MIFPNGNEKLIRIVIASFAVLSAPSAYLFGLTVLFPVSMRTLVDYKFFANELLTFVVFVAGLSAAIRIQLAVVRLMYLRFIDPQSHLISAMPAERVIRRRRVGFFLVALSTICLFFLASIVTSTLLTPHFFLKWLVTSIGVTLFGGFGVVVVGVDTEISAAAIRSRLGAIITKPTSLLSSPLSVSFIVGVSLFSSFGLGSARIQSLASARDVCIELERGNVKGKLLGETSGGLFLKIGELKLRPYLDFTGRFDRFSAPQHQFIFVSRQHVVSINSVCPEQTG